MKAMLLSCTAAILLAGSAAAQGPAPVQPREPASVQQPDTARRPTPAPEGPLSTPNADAASQAPTRERETDADQTRRAQPAPAR